MQIHEITQQKIDEGIGSFLGKAAGGISNIAGKVAGAISPIGPAKNAYTSAVRPQQIAMLGKKITDIWANYAQQLKTATPDPTRYADLYEKSLTAFVQKNLLSGQSINSVTNKQEITKLISDITNAKDNPQDVAKLLPKLVQQATVSMSSTQNQASVQVVSQNPMVVQFRNKTYILSSTPGQQGEWTDQATGKSLDPTWQAYLDKETGLNQP
jgi:hypothetical protein